MVRDAGAGRGEVWLRPIGRSPDARCCWRDRWWTLWRSRETSAAAQFQGSRGPKRAESSRVTSTPSDCRCQALRMADGSCALYATRTSVPLTAADRALDRRPRSWLYRRLNRAFSIVHCAECFREARMWRLSLLAELRPGPFSFSAPEPCPLRRRLFPARCNRFAFVAAIPDLLRPCLVEPT
jgi:hypothetical protein